MCLLSDKFCWTACAFDKNQTQVSQVAKEHHYTAECCGNYNHTIYNNLEHSKEGTSVEQNVDDLTKEGLKFGTDGLADGGQHILNIEETCQHRNRANNCQQLDYLS